MTELRSDQLLPHFAIPRQALLAAKLIVVVVPAALRARAPPWTARMAYDHSVVDPVPKLLLINIARA